MVLLNKNTRKHLTDAILIYPTYRKDLVSYFTLWTRGGTIAKSKV